MRETKKRLPCLEKCVSVLGHESSELEPKSVEEFPLCVLLRPTERVNCDAHANLEPSAARVGVRVRLAYQATIPVHHFSECSDLPFSGPKIFLRFEWTRCDNVVLIDSLRWRNPPPPFSKSDRLA